MVHKMNATLQLDKYEGENLLVVHISRAGYAGEQIELPISTTEFEHFKKLGVTDLTESEQ